MIGLCPYLRFIFNPYFHMVYILKYITIKYEITVIKNVYQGRDFIQFLVPECRTTCMKMCWSLRDENSFHSILVSLFLIFFIRGLFLPSLLLTGHFSHSWCSFSDDLPLVLIYCISQLSRYSYVVFLGNWYSCRFITLPYFLTICKKRTPSQLKIFFVVYVNTPNL